LIACSNRPARLRARAPRLAAALVLAGALQACAHLPSPKTPRLALMPVDAVGVPPGEGARLHQAIGDALRRSRTARISSDEALQRSLHQRRVTLPECLEAEPCLAAVGQELSTDFVLSVTMAGLGDMRLVRSRLFKVDQGIMLKEMQQTSGGSPEQLEDTAAQLTRRLFPPRPGRPWYRRWWVWAASAAVVGAAVGITALATTKDTPQEPGVIRLGDL